MAHAGIVHKYTSRLIAFEHTHTPPSSSPSNTLLWLGGLGDGLLTVPYPSALAVLLPPTWSLAEVLISSSYKGWGTGSLARDARELASCVAYFHALRPGGKIVLMGHSTGCQDIMEYVVGAGSEERCGIDGAILQGGVSDREAWADMLATTQERETFASVVNSAKELIEMGMGKEVLSRERNTVVEELGAPMSAYRTYSLLAEGGDDDYFSEDLSDEVLRGSFGRFPTGTPVCFLLGEKDPYVPKRIDKVALLARWTRIIREGGGVVDDVNGGVVPGAHHNLDEDPEEVVNDLAKRVVGFLIGLGKNDWSSTGARL